MKRRAWLGVGAAAVTAALGAGALQTAGATGDRMRFIMVIDPAHDVLTDRDGGDWDEVVEAGDRYLSLETVHRVRNGRAGEQVGTLTTECVLAAIFGTPPPVGGIPGPDFDQITNCTMTFELPGGKLFGMYSYRNTDLGPPDAPIPVGTVLPGAIVGGDERFSGANGSFRSEVLTTSPDGNATASVLYRIEV